MLESGEVSLQLRRYESSSGAKGLVVACRARRSQPLDPRSNRTEVKRSLLQEAVTAVEMELDQRGLPEVPIHNAQEVANLTR